MPLLDRITTKNLRGKTYLGQSLLSVLLFASIITLLVIVLAVGLGVGLSKGSGYGRRLFEP